MNWFTYDADRGPKSSFARYAYGYSDVKPHWSVWVIWFGLLVVTLISVATMWPD